MVSAGVFHTVLLRSDGKVAIAGGDGHGQCRLPPENFRYKHVSAGGTHTLLLSRCGKVLPCGSNEHGQCNLPSLESDLEYVQVSAGLQHSVGLRSDGIVTYAGMQHGGSIPKAPFIALRDEAPFQAGYVQVSAGYCHTALLRSDGVAVAFGTNELGQCDVPASAGYSNRFVQVSAGANHTVLLAESGDAFAVGSNRYHQCDLPACRLATVLQPDTPATQYVRVSAGLQHTLLLRADGNVDAAGWNNHGQCDIPPLDEGVTYVQASAGAYHSALLRSDGQAVIIGSERFGKCRIPAVFGCESWGHWLLTRPVLPQGVEYVPDFAELAVGPSQLPDGPSCRPVLTVQVVSQTIDEVCHVQCLSLAGNALATFDVHSDATVRDVHLMMMDKLDRRHWDLLPVLPSGRLLTQCRGHELWRVVTATHSADASEPTWLTELASMFGKEELMTSVAFARP